jgi:hypothetical protein
MSDLTGSLELVCQYLFELLEANKDILQLEDVFYGDQDKLPRTPAACVEPGEKDRELKGAQRMTRVTFRIYVLIYHSAVTSPQSNRRSADRTAEAIEGLIHSDPRMGGLVIHGFCTNVSSGYANRTGTLVRASRITFEAQSQELLPSN